MSPRYNEDWPFIARLLFDPVRALDLIDQHGKADYSKIIPVTVIYGVLALFAIGKPLAVGIVLTLLAASFGQSMFRSFLKARTVVAAEAATFSGKLELARQEVISRAITERRDHALGIEPTDD